MEGFGDVLSDFYQEAGIEKLWNQFQPAYNEDISTLREPLNNLVQLETGYLREVIPGDGVEPSPFTWSRWWAGERMCATSATIMPSW